MRRIGVGAAALLSVAMITTLPTLAAAEEASTPLTVDRGSTAINVSPTKINVMGLWAHPDDDAGYTTPCGVWQDQFDIKCGIIMETRGEGGSNSVGPEAGPELGLRRENEDRTSHYRSGTLDIYNVDRVDFFYNTSAPLTADIWDKEEGLKQTVRIIRETQPDILMASSTQAAGHGNHQYAQGRMVWEAAKAAADPNMYPDQLSGPDAVQPWEVKKIIGGGSSTGTGGSTNSPNCTTGFTPAANNPYTVVGVWTGYDSPYNWVEGNVQGMPAGTPKIWAQVGSEGGRAHPTQARTMQKATVNAGCTRYSVTKSLVPIQPNGTADAGRDDAILFGATIADPGGMPLGSKFYVDPDRYFVAPGVPFTVTVSMQSGGENIETGFLSLEVPAGWTASPAQRLSGSVTSSALTTRTFTVTPPASAVNAVGKISASFDNGAITAYNDTRVSVIQEIEGRFQRWGNQAEYEEWAAEYTWLAGRGAAHLPIGAGESVSVPVVVTNSSTTTKSGTVDITAPAGFSLDAASKPFTDLASGASTTVDFVLTHNSPTLAPSVNPRTTITMPIVTTSGSVSSTDNVVITLVPTTVIPELPTAPVMTGDPNPAPYTGEELSLAGRWEGSACSNTSDCGGASYAKIGWHGDDLYVYAYVVDEQASGAVTPANCFGHWLVDSVEILLDPQGDSVDTSTTFKSGLFPFTNDPDNFNGNGANGPCWSRDADNHQGFSTGPLAANVKEAPNSPGQQVKVKAVRDGDGVYDGGAWEIETKIPLANLPAAILETSPVPTGVEATNTVDPQYMGLNVTPYDSDVQNFIGNTRTAWSNFGGQQSEPYRWGHAYLEDYEPPAGRPTKDLIVADSGLFSVDSPQSVYQSATRGVTLSGQQPTRAARVDNVSISDTSVDVKVTSSEAGTARVFLWNGRTGMIPVWTSSCEGDTDGFDACGPDDGAAPPWTTADMGGYLMGSLKQDITAGTSTLSVAITSEIHSRMESDSLVLVSFESASHGVNAWSYPVVPQVDGIRFVDVPGSHTFATEINWMADRGITTGYQIGGQDFFKPADSVHRDAVAAFLYRWSLTDWEPPAGQQTFTDVPPTHQFYKQIEWMAEEGLTTGFPDGTFRGALPIERQAFAAFLYRYAGEPAVTGAPPFSDVAPTSPFAAAITWAAENGVTNGWPDGTFRPALSIERQAVAAMLSRAERLVYA